MDMLRHWINGKYRDGENFIGRRRPADGEHFADVPTASIALVHEAVRSAQAASETWKNTSIKDRCRLVGAMATWLADRYGKAGEVTPIKKLIADEVGKPLPEADIEVIETSDFLRFYSEIGPRVLRSTTPKLDANLWPTKRATLSYEPLGVVAIIKPWNYPLEMIGWTLGPALVAGNTCVIKPSEKSSMCGELYAKMAHDLGFPAGVVNVVFGDGATGAALASCDGVNMVSFTGSIRAGKQVARACADRLARTSLELSGNDAAIVLADADIEMAVNGVVWGAFCNAGQVCVGIKRVLVAKEIYNSFVAQVTQVTNSLIRGRDYGPIIDQSQVEAIEQLVEDALGKGAKPLTGGSRVDQTSYFPPTVLVNVSPSSRLLRDECFGPVLPIIPFDDLDEAIRLANSSDYGLGASIWTANIPAAEAAAKKLDVGMVWINDVNIAVPQAPWSGRKSSGLGYELSDDAILEYSVRKHLNVETSNDKRRPWWFPYA